MTTREKELENLRKKNVQLSSSIVSHQQNLEQTTQELSHSRQQVRRLEINASNINSEKEILKGTEKRLLQENATLSKEKAQQQSLIENLQSLLQTKERNDSESQNRWSSEISALEQERFNSCLTYC